MLHETRLASGPTTTKSKPNKPRTITHQRREQNRVHQARYREKKRKLQQEGHYISLQEQPILAQTAIRQQDLLDSSPCGNSFLTDEEYSVIGQDISSTGTNGAVYSPLDYLFFDVSSDYQEGVFAGFTPARSMELGHTPQGNAIDLQHDLMRKPSSYPETQVSEYRRHDRPGTTPRIEQVKDRDSSDDGRISVTRRSQQNKVTDLSTLRQMVRKQIDELQRHKSFQTHAVMPSRQATFWDGSFGFDDQEALQRTLIHMQRTADHDQSAAAGQDMTYTTSPRTGHLRLHRVNNLAAFLANGLMLGIEIELAPAAYHKSRGRFISPIWETCQLLGEDPEAVAALYAHVSRDLQPCVEQTKQQHPLFVDMLPFPEFRRRFLAVGSVHPPLFDYHDLCDDFDRGGMVCWGTRGSGTPWDSRSWEARPWFLKKWWMLFGDEGGDVYAQSKWYWDLQGLEYD